MICLEILQEIAIYYGADLVVNEDEIEMRLHRRIWIANGTSTIRSALICGYADACRDLRRQAVYGYYCVDTYPPGG
jgi:hypothetical protein